MDWICVMCGGEIPLDERDRSYAEMFSGRRPKVLHAVCHTKLKTERIGGRPVCVTPTCPGDVTEYCSFCFWMFCAEHSPRDYHACETFVHADASQNKLAKPTPEELAVITGITNIGEEDNWSAEAIAEDGAKTVRSRGPQYNVTDKRGERSMTAIVEIMNILRRGRTGPWTTRDGWLLMIVLKLVRGSMPTPLRDTFVDLAGYAGLAGEERGEELKRE